MHTYIFVFTWIMKVLVVMVSCFLFCLCSGFIAKFICNSVAVEVQLDITIEKLYELQ